MSQQNRINYAVQAIGIKGDGDTTSYTPVYGGQSVSMNVTFNSQRYFMLGMSNVYQNIEDTPDVSVTVSKFLDGRPLVYHLATKNVASDTLLGGLNAQCITAWSVVDDTSDSVSGTPLTTAEASGLFVSSLNYTFNTDGPFTEEVTLAGNHIEWSPGGSTKFGSAFTGTIFDNTETPLNITESGGLQTRERFIFAGQSTVSLLPSDIPGITSSGFNPTGADGYPVAKVTSISLSADFGRENVNQLGIKAAYYKNASLPIDVNTTIDVNSLSGNYISATNAGIYGNGDNTQDQPIKIVLKDGSIFDLGTKNRLQSVEYGGGDTGGGESTDSYNYQNANFLIISQPQDPN